MFNYRLCTMNDVDVWIAMNREFMVEEIQDDSLWNNTGDTDDEKFYHTFVEFTNNIPFFTKNFPLIILQLNITI